MEGITANQSKLMLLSDELYEAYCSKFYAQVEIDVDGSTTAASEYISLIVHPYNGEARSKFIEAADWLAIKANPKIEKKSGCRIVKVLPYDLSFKTAEERERTAIQHMEKAIKAWHAHRTSISENQSLQKSFSAVAEAYAIKEDELWGNTFDGSNFNNTIYKPYRGILHLVEGFVQSYMYPTPLKNQHTMSAIADPYWVSSAIERSKMHLRAQLVEDYLRSTSALQGGSRAALRLNEILDVRQKK